MIPFHKTPQLPSPAKIEKVDNDSTVMDISWRISFHSMIVFMPKKNRWLNSVPSRLMEIRGEERKPSNRASVIII